MNNKQKNSKVGPNQSRPVSNTDSPSSVIEAVALLAPESLRQMFEPGPGFDALQGKDRLEWRLASTEEAGASSWNFIYESLEGLKAHCAVQLDAEYGVAVYKVTLTNSSSASLKPFTTLHSMLFRIKGTEDPRIFSCSGASSCSEYWHWSGVREYPASAFRTRTIIPIYPRPVEFTSGGGGERLSGSSNQDLPIIMLSPGMEWDSPGMFFGLEWSTGWRARISFEGARDRIQVVMGPEVKDLVLEAGESLELPPTHIGFFEKGFESGSNACRHYIHQRLTPLYRGKRLVPPISYHMWPGMGLARPQTEKELYPHVDAAADLGVEMFCLDVSWWPGGYEEGLGNWEVDLEKFPNGLEPFSEYLRSKGMGLGLYFDATAVRGTKLAREHPEFFYKLPPHFKPLKYNFGSPEACDYLIKMIGDFVERYDLRYIWEDFFLDPLGDRETFSWEMVEPKGKAQFAHIKGLYRVWETLTRRYPKLMLELNNGGGNSLDLGSMSRNHCNWGNDHPEHPHACHMMQLGVNTFIPANYIGLSVGPYKGAITTGFDAGYPDLSFLSRMAGEFIFHGNLADWPPEIHQRAKHWIGVFKKIRHLLVKDYYRLLPQPQSEADWDAAQFCNGPKEGVIFVFRFMGNTDSQLLFLRSLYPDKEYRIGDEADGQEKVISGKDLRTKGLNVAIETNSAKLYYYRAM